MLSLPTIVLNVKTYAEATGESAYEIAQLMDNLAQENDASLAIAVQATADRRRGQLWSRAEPAVRLQ